MPPREPDAGRGRPPTVRRARATDQDAVAEVLIAAFGGLTFLPTLHTEAEHRAFVRDEILGALETWVAEADGRVVGFASLGDGVLRHLYVHPDAQRRGAGAALLARAKRRRPEGFTFWVFQQNAGARRFYEAHGCRCVRLTDGSGNEERTPDALYAWDPRSRD